MLMILCRPAWRKYAIVAIMSLYAAVTNFNAAVVGPALPIMQYEVQPVQPFAKLNYLVAVNVLLIGTSNLIWVPVANTVGRRPVLIFAMLATTAFSVWCGVARSFGSLLAARALQGFSSGPADAIAPNVLGEVFFVHERGRAMVICTIRVNTLQTKLIYQRPSTPCSLPAAALLVVSQARISPTIWDTSTSFGCQRY